MKPRTLLFLLTPTFLFPAASSAQVVEYYSLDAIGSVRVVTDRQAKVIERHDYLPFGEECTTGPCASNPGVGAGQSRKFTGKERDPETTLDYFGARYYGSPIGRFTTVDPTMTIQANLLDPQRWNRYAYATSNPLRYVDPDGRELRTTELARMQQIAGPAGQHLVITNGRLDVSGLTAGDLVNNEGALLLSQLAGSQLVFTYEEGRTIDSAGGRRAINGAANLDNNPDWRYSKGKLPTDLPPSGVDVAIGVDTSYDRVDAKTRTKVVSQPATAFHELAEGFAKATLGIPYKYPGGRGVGAHDNAVLREGILIGQRPDFTGFPAGGDLARKSTQ